MNASVSESRVTRLHHALDEALELVTGRVESTIRELQRALTITAVNRRPVDSELAEIVLREAFADGQQPVIDAPIVMAVAPLISSTSQSGNCAGLAGPNSWRGPGRSPCICVGNWPVCHCPVSGAISAAVITRRCCTPPERIRHEITERGHTRDQVTDLTALITRRAAMAAVRSQLFGPDTTPGHAR